MTKVPKILDTSIDDNGVVRVHILHPDGVVETIVAVEEDYSFFDILRHKGVIS